MTTKLLAATTLILLPFKAKLVEKLSTPTVSLSSPPTLSSLASTLISPLKQLSPVWSVISAELSWGQSAGGRPNPTQDTGHRNSGRGWLMVGITQGEPQMIERNFWDVPERTLGLESWESATTSLPSFIHLVLTESGLSQALRQALMLHFEGSRCGLYLHGDTHVFRGVGISQTHENTPWQTGHFIEEKCTVLKDRIWSHWKEDLKRDFGAEIRLMGRN